VSGRGVAALIAAALVWSFMINFGVLRAVELAIAELPGLDCIGPMVCPDQCYQFCLRSRHLW